LALFILLEHLNTSECYGRIGNMQKSEREIHTNIVRKYKDNCRKISNSNRHTGLMFCGLNIAESR
jgi:hypothetical protein